MLCSSLHSVILRGRSSIQTHHLLLQRARSSAWFGRADKKFRLKTGASPFGSQRLSRYSREGELFFCENWFYHILLHIFSRRKSKKAAFFEDPFQARTWQSKNLIKLLVFSHPFSYYPLSCHLSSERITQESREELYRSMDNRLSSERATEEGREKTQRFVDDNLARKKKDRLAKLLNKKPQSHSLRNCKSKNLNYLNFVAFSHPILF